MQDHEQPSVQPEEVAKTEEASGDQSQPGADATEQQDMTQETETGQQQDGQDGTENPINNTDQQQQNMQGMNWNSTTGFNPMMNMNAGFGAFNPMMGKSRVSCLHIWPQLIDVCQVWLVWA